MKKRFVCALLALVLLVGLVPVTASAAENKISESAITVLKQLKQFKATCYYVSGSEYRVGYGTVCSEKHHFDVNGRPKATDDNKHTISEKKADTALRTYLTELDKKVNSFASSNGLTLSQSQHDALVVYSHVAGTAWLSGTGTLKSAIVSKAGATELLNVLDNLDGNSERNSKRNQVIVDMYIHGVYSNTAPDRYQAVTYDVNSPDGADARLSVCDEDTYTMYFDTTQIVSHITATCPGYKFLGWYTEPIDGKWMPKLDAACVSEEHNPDKVLYAYWQEDDDHGVAVQYTMHTSQLASTTVFVRPEDGSEAALTSAGKSASVSGSINILQDFLDGNGNRWGYLEYETDQFGWVKIGKTIEDIPAANVIATATVTYNGYLNVRKDAGTDAKIVGALSRNDTVKLYEIKTVNGHRWGRYDGGWICLTYTTVTMLDGKTANDTSAASFAFTGKVTKDVEAYVAAGDNSGTIHFTDASGADYFDIPSGTAIKMSALTVAPFFGDSATWAKVNWTNWELDKDSKPVSVTRTAWLPIAGTGIAKTDEPDYAVELDPVMYTVVAESTNVRKNAGDASELAFSLNKGVEVEISEIRLVDENIWGKITSYTAVSTGDVGEKTGWINLASKYVKRTNEITLPEEEKKEDDHETGLIATVIDTDSVRVRKTGALYGAVIGSLKRGTTVRVWESKKDEWFKLDTNQNGTYDYDGDGWVSAKYLNVRKGALDDPNKVTDAAGNTITTDGSGTGIVANTYSGVNVRQGAGIGYAAVGKLLPGTQVQILEVKTSGAAKWGRTDKGWVCMDYISMVKYNPVAPEKPKEDPTKGTLVDSLDSLEKTTTTAVYTGKVVPEECDIFREPIDFESQYTGDEEADAEVKAKYDANLVRSLKKGDNVTIHELAAVTQKVKSDKDPLGDSNTVTTITTTTYWARVNDGWIINPEENLALTALDEKVHTVTGDDTLKVREGASQDTAKIDTLKKGDQVKVTALQIENDKVWGRIETEEGTGWIRMDYMSEGAYYVEETTTPPATTAPSEPIIGAGGNSGGFVTNASGYRYTGKVIRANELNVRATASTTAKKTTTLKNGASLVIYETTIAENMAWGRCDAGWVYLYYVDLTPCVAGAVDARVVANENTVAYSDVNCTTATGTYQRMAVVDIYEIVGKMAKTDLGWINTDNLL